MAGYLCPMPIGILFANGILSCWLSLSDAAGILWLATPIFHLSFFIFNL
jgi:hypothetical protein